MARSTTASRLKSILVLPALILAVAGVVRGIIGLIGAETAVNSLLPLGWLLAALPVVFKQTALAGTGRVFRLGGKPGALIALMLAALAGLAGSLIGPQDPENLAFLLLVLLNTAMIEFWFPRLPAPEKTLKVGDTMPDVPFHTPDGQTIRPADLRDKPTFYLFFRGNWCPLCVAQIRAVANHYKTLEARGARVALVSPQPDAETARLGERMGVDFTLLTDPDLKAAETLGLYHGEGVPAPMRGRYGASTVLPTLILVDTTGTIRFIDRTDDYRVRPEPDVMIDILDQENIAAT